MKNKLILFDIDYTLFNVAKYREIVFAKLQGLLPEISDVVQIAMQAYDEMRTRGTFDPTVFTDQLVTHIDVPIDRQILTNLWWDEDLLMSSLYEETVAVIESLAQEKDIELGIFSSGVEKLQRGKIQKIVHYFSGENIHIDVLKDTKLPEIVAKNADKKIILVDDYIPVIEKAKAASSHLTTIWIKRGRMAEKVLPSEQFPPDHIITDLRQMLPIIASI